MKLVLFGEILYDVFGKDVFLGGACTNVCGHMAKLGEETLLLSRVGNDEQGENALSYLKSIGVETSYITVDHAHPTGEVPVTLSGEGIPTYEILTNRAYDYIQYTADEMQGLKSKHFDCFYFGTLNQRHPVARETLAKLLKNVSYDYSFYDINLRKDCYNKETIHHSLQKADIFKINDEELLTVNSLFNLAAETESETVLRLFETYPIKITVVTKGKQGATVYTREAQKDIPAFPTKVVDTVGAGDAFCAAFLQCYGRTKDPFLAARAGNLLGSYVAGKRGAIPEYDGNLLDQLKIIGR